MTNVNFEKAIQITEEIKGIENELEAWRMFGRDGIVDPLMFRMLGVLKHVPPGAFEAFRDACIIGMNQRQKELAFMLEQL